MKTVIKYYATWCGPCKIYAPTFNSVKEKMQDENIQFIDINVEETSEYRSKYKVTSIPYTVLEIDGEMVKDKTGMMSEAALLDFINS